MKIFDEIKKVPPRELENAGVISRARKSGYICKVCGNGTGKDGDGLTVKEYDWGYNYHCFGKCGENYTAVDLIAAHIGAEGDMGKVAEWWKEHFDLSFTEKRKVVAPMSEQVTEPPQKDYSEFYQLAQDQLAEFIESCGGKFRGLTLKDWQEVGAGIATATDLKAVGENVPASCRCLILPYSKHRFLMRSVGDNPAVKRGNKGGEKTEIYNPYKVNFEKPVFVVEGEIDAVSIHAAGFQAVATSGAGEYKLLIDGLKKAYKPAVRVILMFDNNDSGAGQKNALQAKIGLLERKIKAVNYILSPNKRYDANEFLQADSEEFRERLTEIYKQAEIEFEQMEREKMKSAGIEILADVFDDLDEMTEKVKGDLLKWGFPTLDKKLPLLPGCYLLGALPSLGKTTFALNVAGNICEQGKKVLYISYEPTAKQIAMKDLAGYWFKKIWENHRDNRSPELVPTATQMMLGKYSERFTYEEMKRVREELKEKRRNFYFLQGQRETASALISKIKSYVDSGLKFIAIDYIQLLKGADNSKTVREQIDATIHELQRFQAENDLVILFISAFNRENYRNYACLESFKESGGLEYTADAILALQFEYSNTESRADNQKFQQKKQEQPRNMELVCLKNRFGTDFVDRFAYHSAHETFIEKSQHTDETADEDVDED